MHRYWYLQAGKVWNEYKQVNSWTHHHLNFAFSATKEKNWRKARGDEREAEHVLFKNRKGK